MLNCETTLNTGKEITDSVAKITITHPFHPDKGKTFEYLGQRNERVRYLDNQGNIRQIPINNTSLYIAAVDAHSVEGNFVAPVYDLLALKELIDMLVKLS